MYSAGHDTVLTVRASSGRIGLRKKTTSEIGEQELSQRKLHTSVVKTKEDLTTGAFLEPGSSIDRLQMPQADPTTHPSTAS